MFDQDYQYLPSLREIRDGLIEGQLRVLEMDKQEWHDGIKFEQVKVNYNEKWLFLFEIANLGNLDKPLTIKTLSNLNHKITKHLLYMYSMESFICKHMNRVCRAKDIQSIHFYGAFAAALSQIIYLTGK